MLDFLRRSATSVFAWIILGVLALVFGLSFGLPSDSLTLGAEKIVKVHGKNVGDEEYRYQYNLSATLGLVPKEPERRQMLGVNEEVLESVIERIVLAEAAEDLGLQATIKEAEDEVLKGHFIVFGFTIDFSDLRLLAPNQAFNYDLFKNAWLKGLNVAEPHYLEYQRQEVLARTVRDLIESSVVVSEADLRKEYDKTANQLSLRYARYDVSAFADLVDPTPAEIEAYREAHRDALETQFSAQGSRFLKLSPQHRLWLVSVPKPSGSVDAEGEPTAADPGDMAAARKLAELAHKKITDGRDFRTIARELSQHETAARGGDYGWVGGSSGLDIVVDETAAQLEIGEFSEVLDGETAFWVIRVTGRREGDVPQDDALFELAEEAVKTEKAKALAHRAATEDKDAVLGGKPLTSVFRTPGALGLDVAPGDDEPIEDRGTDDARPEPRTKAELIETGPFGKAQPVPGLGPSPEIVDAAWAAEDDVDLLDQVFEVPAGYVIVGRVSKQASTDEGFAQGREDLYDTLVQRKANGISAHWAKRRCLEAKAKGDIKVSEEKIKRLMTYDTKEGDSPFGPYSVCDRVGERGGVMTMRLRFYQ